MRIHADRAGCSHCSLRALKKRPRQSTNKLPSSTFCLSFSCAKTDWLKKQVPSCLFVCLFVCLFPFHYDVTFTYTFTFFYISSMPLTLLLLCACQIPPGVERDILPHMKHNSLWRELLSTLIIQLSDHNQKWVSQHVLEHMRGCLAVYFRSESPENCLCQHPKPNPFDTPWGIYLSTE